MGTDRFLGFLDWFMGRQKPDKIRKAKTPVRRSRAKKYLITFEVQENQNAAFIRESFILTSDFKKWFDFMQKNNNKIIIILIHRL